MYRAEIGVQLSSTFEIWEKSNMKTNTNHNISIKILTNFKCHGIRASQEAGRILQNYLGKAALLKMKTDNQLVTSADIRSETRIARYLNECFRKHNILGEEGTKIVCEEAEFCWTIDPLSGTNNYAQGLYPFGIQLALWRENTPLLGILRLYTESKRAAYYAIYGSGSYTLDRNSSVKVGIPEQGRPVLYVHPNPGVFNLPKDLKTTTSGCLVDAYVGLVEGRYAGILYQGADITDIGAGAIFVREAGGEMMVRNRRGLWTPNLIDWLPWERKVKKEFTFVAAHHNNIFHLLELAKNLT